ncbi:MAG: cbb3-type cytochrome c oxidase subunit I [Oligoflexales bacterium]|nr:cbb3-type cytochrome c oxidase subunit I [Oligoflexales bacterium]
MIDLKLPKVSVSVAFMVTGAFMLFLGTFYGLISAIDLVAPSLFNSSILVFGRTRPIHTNTVIYGFVAETLIGAGLYYVPALLKTSLWSERLGWISFTLWTLTVLSGPITFSMGYSQGREYAEYLWIFDITLVLSVIFMIVNLIMTISIRKESFLYVSVWYFTATFLWTSFGYVIGNVIWHPSTGATSGIVDSILLWFYGHNLVGLLLTPLAIGAMFYIVPRVANTPLYSHTLSILGFWSLVTLYSHIGGHHILYAPIPNWLKVVSEVDSGAMSIPVIIVLFNMWMTARGRGSILLKDPSGRFIMASAIWYFLTGLQGSFQSIAFVQRVTHFTNWTIGHSHIAVLGFSGYAALGALWYILPYATGFRLYSVRLVNLQFWLVTFGLVGFFSVLTIAGLIQGGSWNGGETVYKTLPLMKPYMFARAMFGISIISGALLGLFNIFMTFMQKKPFLPKEIFP